MGTTNGRAHGEADSGRPALHQGGLHPALQRRQLPPQARLLLLPPRLQQRQALHRRQMQASPQQIIIISSSSQGIINPAEIVAKSQEIPTGEQRQQQCGDVLQRNGDEGGDRRDERRRPSWRGARPARAAQGPGERVLQEAVAAGRGEEPLFVLVLVFLVAGGIPRWVFEPVGGVAAGRGPGEESG